MTRAFELANQIDRLLEEYKGLVMAKPENEEELEVNTLRAIVVMKELKSIMPEVAVVLRGISFHEILERGENG